MKEKLIIGVLGGMGTYATINFFDQYAKVFEAEKEWERPRIIIDNRCTMPSRVRAFLYNDKFDQLVEEMTDSMRYLSNAGANKIILACNTSHLFLPYIYNNLPEAEDKVVHIIDACVNKIVNDKLDSVYILGSEGTIESKIYQNKLSENHIESSAPNADEYEKLRLCIEAVKQNKYTNDVKWAFCELINRQDACILGCTELPVLYNMYKDEITCNNVYDPLKIVLENLKEVYDNE